MMKCSLLGLMALVGLLAAEPCSAQLVKSDPSVNGGTWVIAHGVAYGPKDSTATFVDETHPLPMKTTLIAATSTVQAGTVTSSAVTPTSGVASFSAGTATIKLTDPQLGRQIVVITTGGATYTAALKASTDNCVTTIPIMIADTAWGVFTTDGYRSIEPATATGVSFCQTYTVTSGTLTYRMPN